MASYRKSGVRLLDENELLEMERFKEDALAPAVAPTEYPQPDQESIETAPEELKSNKPEAPYSPKEDADLAEHKTRLAAARKQQDERQLLAALGRAGAGLVEGVTGAKADTQFYDSLSKQAAQPVTQANEDYELAKLAKTAREKQEKEDPNSPFNRAAQETLRNTIPTLARSLGDENLKRMTKKQIDEQLGVNQKERELSSKDKTAEALQNYRRAQDENADLSREQSQAQFDERMPVEKYKAESGRIAAQKVPYGALISAGNADRREAHHQGDALIKYHKDTEKFRPLYAAMEEIEKRAPGLTAGDVPPNIEFGTVEQIRRSLPGGWGARFSAKNDTVVNSLYSKLRTDIQFGTAGASLTPQEKANYDRIFSDNLGSPADVKAAIIAALRGKLKRELEAAEAAYLPSIGQDTWSTYIGSGKGIGPGSALFGSGKPSNAAAPKLKANSALGAPVRVRILKGKNAGKIGTLPEAAAKSAIADGSAESAE